MLKLISYLRVWVSVKRIQFYCARSIKEDLLMEIKERIGLGDGASNDDNCAATPAAVDCSDSSEPTSTTPESTMGSSMSSADPPAAKRPRSVAAGEDPGQLSLDADPGEDSAGIPSEGEAPSAVAIPAAFEAEFDRIVASVSPCEDSAKYRAHVYGCVEVTHSPEKDTPTHPQKTGRLSRAACTPCWVCALPMCVVIPPLSLGRRRSSCALSALPWRWLLSAHSR